MFIVVVLVVVSAAAAPVAQFVVGLSSMDSIVVERSWIMIEG
jgi:hypothetical protein